MFAELRKMDSLELVVTLLLAPTLGPSFGVTALIFMALTGQGTTKGVLFGLGCVPLFILQFMALRVMIHGF